MQAFQNAPVAAPVTAVPVYTYQANPNQVNLQMQQTAGQDQNAAEDANNIFKAAGYCICSGISFFAIVILTGVIRKHF